MSSVSGTVDPGQETERGRARHDGEKLMCLYFATYPPLKQKSDTDLRTLRTRPPSAQSSWIPSHPLLATHIRTIHLLLQISIQRPAPQSSKTSCPKHGRSPRSGATSPNSNPSSPTTRPPTGPSSAPTQSGRRHVRVRISRGTRSIARQDISGPSSR